MVMRHEGLRLKPYQDTVGKLTIGVGRNLDDVGISEEEARYLLANDLRQIQHELHKQSWFAALNSARQMAITDMAFNLGLPRLLGFSHMITAIETSDYARAASEMLDSRWARQVGSRAEELAEMMRGGSNELE
ncbi:MAG: glycoside hydrolase family protein [Mariprofundales bacterium]